VELAHTGYDPLPGLRIRKHPEGRIFQGEFVQPLVQLLLVCLGLGLNGQGDDRFGKFHFFQDQRMFFGAEGMAGHGLLETRRRHDISRRGLLDLLSLVGVHLHQPADPLPLPFIGVVNRIS
jgi:hypothetical protein